MDKNTLRESLFVEAVGDLQKLLDRVEAAPEELRSVADGLVSRFAVNARRVEEEAERERSRWLLEAKNLTAEMRKAAVVVDGQARRLALTCLTVGAVSGGVGGLLVGVGWLALTQ